jgi:polyhydroxyalkanoate synthesis regulator phasin
MRPGQHGDHDRRATRPLDVKETTMKRTMTAAIAGVALTGIIGVGVAAAATGDGPAGRLADVLSGLVSNGTITQQQADAVGQALDDAREEARAEHEARHAEREAKVEALLQETLGLSVDAVRERIAAGETLKEIAGDKADALAEGAVALAKEQAAQAVSDGRLTQAQADELATRAQERADAWLAGESTGRGGGLGLLLGGRGMGGPGMGGPGMGHGDGMGGRGGWGHRGPDAGDDTDATTSPSTSGTSA